MTPDTITIRQADLDAAVAAGVLSRDTAQNLVAFVASADGTQTEDEQLRLVTGFGDIFVTIGLALFLGALTYLAGPFALPLAAWGMAEVFTRWKRMALPSIVLLLVFGFSVFAVTFMMFSGDDNLWASATNNAGISVAGLVTVIAISLHWLRFRVPITIAAAAAALVALLSGLIGMAAPQALTAAPYAIFLPMGLAVFALAMWFDMGDLRRRTPKTDMAFWLHLLAAPLIVHPLVAAITTVGAMTQAGAVMIFIIFAVLSVVALVVDRRALLVSSLTYLGYALYHITSGGLLGGADSSTSVSILLVGAVVLGLSLAWKPMRRLLLSVMPEAIRASVPAVDATYPKARAV